MIKRATTSLLSLLLVAGLALGGCAGGPAGGPGGAASPTAPGQELTLNLGTEPPTLDPNKATATNAFVLLSNTMEGLVRPDEGGQVEKGSGAAADWQVSADGLTYTFTLKDGLTWSDGEPVTAHDFAYSWLRALDPQTASEYAYQLYYIEGAEAWNTLPVDAPDFTARSAALRDQVAIEVPDDHTLRVRLTTPTPYFLSLMAFPTYLPVRQDYVEQYGDQFASEADRLVYNGPFVISRWAHEAEVILEKNPRYWDAENVRVDRITFQMIKEAQTALNLFDAGELDQVQVPGEFLPVYAEKGLQTVARASTYYITLNTTDPILKNAKVRQALSMALDRTLFVTGVAKDGSVPAAGFTPPSLAGVADRRFRAISGELLPDAARTADARQLLREGLQELGLEQLPPLTLLISDASTTRRYAQGFQEMWRQNLGIDVQLEPVAFKVRLQRARQGDFQMVFGAWVGDYNDPMTFMDMFVTGGGFNDPQWSNARYDALIATAKESTDNQERMDAMAAAERILMTEMPVIPLFHGANNWVTRPGVQGIRYFPLGGDFDLKYVQVG